MRLQSLNRFQLGEGFVAHTPAARRRQPRARNWKTRKGQEPSWLLQGDLLCPHAGLTHGMGKEQL